MTDPMQDQKTSGVMVLAAIVVFACALHLVPEIQAYMLPRWPVIGLGGAVFIAFMLFDQWRRRSGVGPFTQWHWAFLMIYLLHQFEEHGVDIYGRSYHFMAYANAFLIEQFGAGTALLTVLSLYEINTLLVWIAFMLAIWGGCRYAWPGLLAGGLIFTNGLLHIGIGAMRWEYNPGLATAVLLFLPLSVMYFMRVKRRGGWSSVFVPILAGLGAHAALPSVLRLEGTMAVGDVVPMPPMLQGMPMVEGVPTTTFTIFFAVLVMGAFLPLALNMVWAMFFGRRR